jgi:hypothetical protein
MEDFDEEASKCKNEGYVFLMYRDGRFYEEASKCKNEGYVSEGAKTHEELKPLDSNRLMWALFDQGSCVGMRGVSMAVVLGYLL